MNKIKLKIYKNINIVLVYLLQFFNEQHLKIINKLGKNAIDNPKKYETLNPNEDSEKFDGYAKMLQVALKTPNTNNIAVTGTYGSGKSSFLRTFEKKYAEWNYLHISLATFEEPENTKNNNTQSQTPSDNTQQKENQNQLIERSILQQIFYKEKDKNIPFSRFKRIPNIKKKNIILNSIFSGIFILYSLSIFFPETMMSFIGFPLKVLIRDYLFLEILIWMIGCFYFYKIFDYLVKLQVSRFNVKVGEIEINNKDNTSIMNKYLDEVLYFFEVTSYDVVVIEDLDRFDSTEIFIKLRELNTLINNSKDINRRVRFIYAIKDDMFKDKDRTKIFDFIAPIIPYINSTNSFLILKEKLKQEDIGEDFLRNVSLRINDMRLLINIANEYKIYKQKIKPKNKEKLLAMIIYKNFYPSDFAKLHINEGIIFDIFNKRIEFIKVKLNEIKEKISNKQKEIVEYETKIESEKLKSINELRMIYILKILEKINQNYFWIKGTQYVISNLIDLIKNENFEMIKIEEIKRNNSHYENGINFTVIEKEINSELTYNQREEIILNQKNRNLENLKQELQNLKDKINQIKKFNVSEIAKEDESKIFESIEKENLLKFLLRDGYIREDDYHNYISYFFEGGLTEKDREFVLAVKDNKPLNFEYELINKKEVLRNLTSRDFESKAVFNYSLVDFMLENNNTEESLNNLELNLTDESKQSIEFILSFIAISNKQKELINLICKKWHKIWFYIYEESDFVEEKQNEYFEILLDNLKVESLIKLNVENSLQEFIEKSTKLYKYLSADKFSKLIEDLQIKYEYLENPVEENPTLFEFIYKNNLYQLNEKMINKILFIKGEPKETSEEKLKISHYTTIQESEAKELKSYIKQNINEYVENVFLKIDTNIKENEKYIIELLNNEDLDDKYKQKIIQKVETKISDISQIKNKEIWKTLFEQNRINSIWKNILNYYQYNEQQLDKLIVDFISIEENYKNLSNNKIYNEKEFEEEIIKNLSTNLIKLNELDNNCYSYIVKSLYTYTSMSCKLSNEKIDILLKNNKLSLTKENINYLKEYSTNKQIVLIENFKKEFLEKYDEFTLDKEDYIGIFESSKFTTDEKLIIIANLDLTILDNENLAKVVTDIYLNNSIEISNEIFFKLFDNGKFEDSLKLLTNQIPKLEDEKISELLNQFENPYNELTEKSAKPLKFDKTEINEDFLMALNKKGFIGKVDKEKKEIIVNRKRV